MKGHSYRGYLLGRGGHYRAGTWGDLGGPTPQSRRPQGVFYSAAAI